MKDEAYNALVEECAQQVPSNWLDPLLTGKDAPKCPLDEPAVERLLKGITARIRAMKIAVTSGE